MFLVFFFCGLNMIKFSMFIILILLSVVKSHALVDPSVRPDLIAEIPPITQLSTERFKVNEAKIRALKTSPLWCVIRGQLLEKGIDLGYLEVPPLTWLMPASTPILLDHTPILAGELKGVLDQKIDGLIQILNKTLPGAVVLLDFDGVMDGEGQTEEQKRRIHAALNNAKQRGAHIFIYSNGSKFARDTHVPGDNQWLQRTLRSDVSIFQPTPINMPEAMQVGDTKMALFAKKRFEAYMTTLNTIYEKKKDGHIVQRYSPLVHNERLLFLYNPKDLHTRTNFPIDHPTYYRFDPTFLRDEYKPSMMIFGRLGAISVTSSLEFRGRRESMFEESLLDWLCPATIGLIPELRSTLKSVLVDAPIKGNMLPVVLHYLRLSRTIGDGVIPQVIFLDDSPWKVRGMAAAMIKLQEKGRIRQGISVCYDPLKID